MLNERQKKFISEYILNGGNGTAAAKAAGYAPASAKVTASKLLANAEIRAAIDERLEKIHSERVADERELLAILTSIARGESSDEIAMTRLVGKGCSVIEKFELRTPTQQRIRAIETLLKVFGSFRREEEKKNIGGDSLFVQTLTRIWKKEHSAEDSAEA